MSEATSIRTVNSGINHDFKILKSHDLHIGGYASIEIVDKQNDLITLEALNEAVKKFMKEPKYRNVMTNHSNVQVGEVVKEYRDNSGRLWKTDVDDVGFFVVIKLRSDIEKAKEVSREIRKGSLRSFSIGGQALEKRKRNNEDLGDYNEISKLELHEITICEKGINPEAKFDILKMEKNNMSEISEAINELGVLLKSIKENNIEKLSPEAEKRLRAAGELSGPLDEVEGQFPEDPDATLPQKQRDLLPEELELEAGQLAREKSIEEEFPEEEMGIGEDEKLDSSNNTGEKMAEEYLDAENDEADDLELSDFENTEKSKPDLATGQVEAGEAGEVIHDGTAKPKHDQIKVVKNVWNGDTKGLDLSPENLEKAYAEFKAEQMEKLAYEDIKRSFEQRFNREVAVKEDAIAKSEYDPRIEVNELKKQFGELLDTIKNDAEMTFTKQQEAAVANQVNVPTYDEIAKMDWNELHLAVQELEEKSGL